MKKITRYNGYIIEFIEHRRQSLSQAVKRLKSKEA